MSKRNVIAIFDIGKTNKKLFLFDKAYQIVFEKTVVLEETKDEDGFPCENVEALSSFILESFRSILHNPEFDITAVNFSGYGASFVLTDEYGKTVAPLYNYLKPYPAHLLKQFYDTYGGEENFASETASPVLGNLNSGMQLYRIKYERPGLFKNIKHAFHLPQFLSYVICGAKYSDLTSIGCHTNLWNFRENKYHDWVSNEGVLEKLLPVIASDTTTESTFEKRKLTVGIGLHDSSAALIPYLMSFYEPFILISTGTWCISLNPFNNAPLTKHELENDCLCYLQYNGKPVKAARLFAGHMHDEQVSRIADYFHTDVRKYKGTRFNDDIALRLRKDSVKSSPGECVFENRELSSFANDVEAYHQLISDLVDQQRASTSLILGNENVKRIFVDGGFSKNEIYMKLLAAAFPDMDVSATSMAQATALGAALILHHAWNENAAPHPPIDQTHYSAPRTVDK